MRKKTAGVRAVPSKLELGVTEVLEIIKACQRGNVLSFEFAGLSLTFQNTVDEQSIDVAEIDLSPVIRANQPVPRQTRRGPSPTEAELAKARLQLAHVRASEEAGVINEQVESRDLFLENLMVTDPLAYEAAILDESY